MNRTGFASNGNTIVENDHGKADEYIRVGWKPAEGVAQRDAGECADVARAIFDEARDRRDRAIALFQSGSGDRLLARAMYRVPPACQGRRCGSVRSARISPAAAGGSAECAG